MEKINQIESQYRIAKQKYSKFGVDVDKALEILQTIPISIHCWQADDVGGFESPDAKLTGGGIQTTGNYLGKARTVEELRQDYLKAFSLIPCKPRANIHAIYGEFGGKKIDRDAITFDHYRGWVNWAKKHGIGIDFNCTLFSHPKADDGFTLSSKNSEIRTFWINHCIRCREISAEIGKSLGTPCIHNIWISDGYKDLPVDRLGHRELLINSLDRILEKPFDSAYMMDSIEGKLFGIGSEAYVVGSHDFYLSYAVKKGVMLTLDMGHFHPNELIADKISAILPFTKRLLLHISRPMRWDSDHVVILNDDVRRVAEEVIRSRALKDIHIALDFFDASINRIGAWIIGTRATIQALLWALLQPYDRLLQYEEQGKYFQRLALWEEMHSLPFSSIWEMYCQKMGVPIGMDWIKEVEQYETDELQNRV